MSAEGGHGRRGQKAPGPVWRMILLAALTVLAMPVFPAPAAEHRPECEAASAALEGLVRQSVHLGVYRVQLGLEASEVPRRVAYRIITVRANTEAVIAKARALYGPRIRAHATTLLLALGCAVEDGE